MVRLTSPHTRAVLLSFSHAKVDRVMDVGLHDLLTSTQDEATLAAVAASLLLPPASPPEQQRMQVFLSCVHPDIDIESLFSSLFLSSLLALRSLFLSPHVSLFPLPLPSDT